MTHTHMFTTIRNNHFFNLMSGTQDKKGWRTYID